MINLAVIGLGPIGAMHVDNLLASDVAKVVAICDQRPVSDEKYSGLKFYDKVDDLLNAGGFDAVIVATPSFTHYNLAKQIIEAGYNVLIEKPLALCTADAMEVESLAKEKNLLCAIMLNQRTTPIYARIKELLSTGELGKINRVSWTMTNWYRPNIYVTSSTWRGTWKGEAGGALINQSIHNLDILAWAFDMPKSIKAWCKYGKYHDIEVEDEVICHMDLGEGTSLSFITSTGEYTGVNRLEIAGDKAFVVAENGELKITKFKGVSLSEFTRNTDQPFSSPESELIVETFEGNGAQHMGVITNFVRALEGKEELDYKLSEGIKSLELANAMLMSSWTNSEVAMPLDHNAYKAELGKHLENSKLREEVQKVGTIDFSKSFK